MYWYSNYNIVLTPPRRCTKCAANLTAMLIEDKQNIKYLLYSQPNKLKLILDFLTVSRNKSFNLKILDKEIIRVLT
ncbi:S-s bond formation pathway protein [Cetacean poxvirus 1]|nr:S-s bond formation pathway protein [Cetacean poxvirus 1]